MAAIKIESNGATNLLVTLSGGYAIEGADGHQLGVTLNGGAVGPSSFEGWQAIHVEADAES